MDSNLSQFPNLRQAETLPPLKAALARSGLANIIAQLLLSQECREEQHAIQRVQDLNVEDAARFREAAEFVVNYALEPDRLHAAIMCMADVLISDGSDRDIEQHTRRQQIHYRSLAVSALHALIENLKDVPPDFHYRDRMSSLGDAIDPKVQS